MTKLEDLAQKLIEKNPSLLRDMMESEYIKLEIELRQGKIIRCKITDKHYKENS